MLKLKYTSQKCGLYVACIWKVPSPLLGLYSETFFLVNFSVLGKCWAFHHNLLSLASFININIQRFAHLTCSVETGPVAIKGGKSETVLPWIGQVMSFTKHYDDYYKENIEIGSQHKPNFISSLNILCDAVKKAFQCKEKNTLLFFRHWKHHQWSHYFKINHSVVTA